MKWAGLLLSALVLAACGGGDTGTKRVFGQEAEAHCRAWCETEACRAGYEIADCLSSCRSYLAGPCGEHTVAYQQCVRALEECSNQFGDCDLYLRAVDECVAPINEICNNCPEGTVCSMGCGGGCVYAGGDCNVTPYEADCRVQVDAGRCSDFAGCVANFGDCPPEARP